MASFVRHPGFPVTKTRLTGTGRLWKMEVRQWAFAEVNVTDVDPRLKPTSNNPNVVTDHYPPPKSDTIRGAMRGASSDMTVRFYARAPGFTIIHLFETNPFIAAFDGLQVEVMHRRAPKEEYISLTKLLGNTCAINAPDTPAYEMGTTLTFDKTMTDPTRLFPAVPSGLNHLVISSHGGFQTEADKKDVKKMSLYVCGGDITLFRLTIDDVKKAFEMLKGKILENGVIWIGGCTIGSNTDFCAAAARAVDRPVVAPGYALANKKFPKGSVDILDNLALPKVFVPDAGTKFIGLSEFCAKQDAHKFVVPI
jgi:hypothetical protein